MPIKFSLRKYFNPVFVETGSFRGEGITKALRAGFRKIYSIELNEQFYNELCLKFKSEIESGRLVLIHGDSAAVLPGILRGIDERITFWLDAHYCGGITARGTEDTPLLKELDEIARHQIHAHTILVDDVRLFGTKGQEDWSGVHKDNVIARLKQINADYRICFEKGMSRGDVLVAELRGFKIGKLVGRLEESVLFLAGPLLRWIRKAILNRLRKEE